MQTRTNPPHTHRLILLIAGWTALSALFIGIDLTPWLRGGYGWRWTYFPASGAGLVALLLGVAVYLTGALLLARRPRRAGLLLTWALCGSVGLAVLVMAMREGDALYGLFARTASLLGTGPHYTAARVDWAGGEWREWPGVMARFGGHMRNVPPGSLLWYGLLNDLPSRLPMLAPLTQRLAAALMPYQCHNFDLLTYTPAQWASAWFGVLMPVWAALTVLPLYAVARRLLPDAAHAGRLVLWWPLLPGIAAFAGSWNTFYPFVSLLAFWCLLRGLASPHPLRLRAAGWQISAGGLSGLALFTNFAFIPLPMLLGLYTLLACLLRPLSADEPPLLRFWRAVRVGLAYSAGLLLPWLAFWWLTSDTFLDLLGTSMAFHLDLDRPYWFWVVMHLWDWLLWTGVGFLPLGLAGLWLARRRGQPLPLLTLALALHMLILLLSGTARGETGRVWLLFSPFLLIAAYDGLLRLTAGQPARGAWVWLTLAQAALFVAVTGSLTVMATGFTPPPPAPRVIDAPLRPVEALFQADGAAAFRLIGWDASAEDDGFALTLRWQGVAAPQVAYWMGGVLVAPDGRTYPVPPWQPGAALDTPYPTTCWQAGIMLDDRVTLALPGDARKGAWWFSLAVYDAGGAPLPVTHSGGIDQQIGLGPL